MAFCSISVWASGGVIPCTWQQRINPELSYRFQSSLQIFFKALNLVFVCISSEKRFKVMKFWNIYDRSVLHSNKSTRCCSKINFHACSLFSRLIHYHYQFFLLSHFTLMHDLNLLKVYSVWINNNPKIGIQLLN